MARFNRIHAICESVRGKPCKRCPMWEPSPYGKGMPGCYWQALEIANIAVHGNPFGKRGVRKHVRTWRARFAKGHKS